MTLSPHWFDTPPVKTLVAAFKEAGMPMRFVGGAVRDTVLGRPVHDIDVATPALPNDVMAMLADAGITAIPTGIAHGTVTAVIEKKHFEITTLRKDVTTDGRHAEVAYTDDWRQDAMRRDFTMNALYLSAGGELFDYVSGEADAKNGRVRFIGDAGARIREDYLRILRFFRFYAHYGKTAPDNEALAACAAQAAHIELLSAERVQHEMLKLLAAPKSYHAIGFMIERGVFVHVFGFALKAATALRRLEEMAIAFSQELSVAAKMLALALPTCAPIKAFARCWKLSHALSSQLGMLEALVKALSVNLSFPEQKKYIRIYGNAVFKEAVMLAWALESDMIDRAHPYHAMLILAGEWRPPEFPVSGKDLLALGIQEGKRVGEVLRSLEEVWEAGDYKATKEELLARAK